MTITHPNPKEPTVAENDAPQPKPTTEELYPESTKLLKVAPQSQTIGEFVDWLRSEKNVSLMLWVEDDDEGIDYVSLMQPMETLLAEFFEIDLGKVETEKRAMLASFGV